MTPIERFVIELTGRRYARRRYSIWGLAWRTVAVLAALGVIWLALAVAFV